MTVGKIIVREDRGFQESRVFNALQVLGDSVSGCLAGMSPLIVRRVVSSSLPSSDVSVGTFVFQDTGPYEG